MKRTSVALLAMLALPLLQACEPQAPEPPANTARPADSAPPPADSAPPADTSAPPPASGTPQEGSKPAY
ncbi:hypothetical protein [Denitromonas iodatirespirans]|uniref:Uncharacterized protein n=1 Tax=Denitromonas iodatirespirans TaxID=2795389 RepID=A0A944DBZ0_DENI1|nr:hypothetical protein [Denitromonas iodatirespirans]MBT0963689.1 hypothetical protein [Denitromonas iodatirespirans]